MKNISVHVHARVLVQIPLGEYRPDRTLAQITEEAERDALARLEHKLQLRGLEILAKPEITAVVLGDQS